MSLENVLLNQNAFLVDVAQMLNVFSGATTKKIAYACQGLNFETMNVLMSMNVQMDHTNVAMPPVSIWKAHTVAPPRLTLFGLLMELGRIKGMSRVSTRDCTTKFYQAKRLFFGAKPRRNRIDFKSKFFSISISCESNTRF